ncbi:hypothetical protein QUW13_07115 [Enterococcus hirae]|nr:hypothetical protein [Enterococcus hirae]
MQGMLLIFEKTTSAEEAAAQEKFVHWMEQALKRPIFAAAADLSAGGCEKLAMRIKESGIAELFIQPVVMFSTFAFSEDVKRLTQLLAEQTAVALQQGEAFGSAAGIVSYVRQKIFTLMNIHTATKIILAVGGDETAAAAVRKMFAQLSAGLPAERLRLGRINESQAHDSLAQALDDWKDAGVAVIPYFLLPDEDFRRLETVIKECTASGQEIAFPARIPFEPAEDLLGGMFDE